MSTHQIPVSVLQAEREKCKALQRRLDEYRVLVDTIQNEPLSFLFADEDRDPALFEIQDLIRAFQQRTI
jgi:hypothetical protein